MAFGRERIILSVALLPCLALSGCKTHDGDSPAEPQAEESKLSSKESRQLLKDTFIPEVNFVDLPLDEALSEVERMLAEQLPPDQLRPKLSIFSPEDHEHHPPLEEAHPLLGDEEYSRYPKVIELRVRNLPAEVLLRYVADSANTRFWLYEGDVYFGLFCYECMSKFGSEAVMENVRLDASTPGELEQQINDAIEQVEEYHGLKPRFYLNINEPTAMALEKGEAEFPRIEGHWVRTNLDTLRVDIIRQYKGFSLDTGDDLFFIVLGNGKEKSAEDVPLDSN